MSRTGRIGRNGVSHYLIPCLAIVSVAVSALPRPSRADGTPQPAAALTLDLLPKHIVGSEAGQLLIAVDFKSEPRKAILHITAPSGMTAEPADAAFETPARQFTVPVSIRGNGSAGFSDERQIVVTLTLPGSSEGQPVTARTAVTYTPQLSYGIYLLVAAVGVVVGYVLRLLVKVLSTLPVPQAAPLGNNQPQPGPVTKFVQAHYYEVDFIVTLALGFIALLYLGHTGRPPDIAAQWPGAFTLGVGLGGLSNSELFSKLGK